MAFPDSIGIDEGAVGGFVNDGGNMAIAPLSFYCWGPVFVANDNGVDGGNLGRWNANVIVLYVAAKFGFVFVEFNHFVTFWSAAGGT